MHYRTECTLSKTVLYDGILALLKRLSREGAKSYIVTIKPYEALTRILALKGWQELVDGFYCPDMFEGQVKTKAQLIAHVMETELAGKTAIYVGDTFSDVVAAHDNGVKCIAVTYGDGDTEKLLETTPDYVAMTPKDIARFLF